MQVIRYAPKGQITWKYRFDVSHSLNHSIDTNLIQSQS